MSSYFLLARGALQFYCHAFAPPGQRKHQRIRVTPLENTRGIRGFLFPYDPGQHQGPYTEPGRPDRAHSLEAASFEGHSYETPPAGSVKTRKNVAVHVL